MLNMRFATFFKRYKICTLLQRLKINVFAKMSMPRTLPKVKEKVRRCEGVEGRVDYGSKRWEMLLRR